MVMQGQKGNKKLSPEKAEKEKSKIQKKLFFPLLLNVLLIDAASKGYSKPIDWPRKPFSSRRNLPMFITPNKNRMCVLLCLKDPLNKGTCPKNL